MFLSFWHHSEQLCKKIFFPLKKSKYLKNKNFHQLWGEFFFAFLDELDHFKHKIKSAIMTSRICFTYKTEVSDSSPILPKLRNKNFTMHNINIDDQLQQDFQNPVCGWLLVATTLLFPTYILSSLASSFRAEISIS